MADSNPVSDNPHLDGKKPGTPIRNSGQLLHAQLLFEDKPSVDKERLLEELKRIFDQVKAPESEQKGVEVFFFPEFPVQFKDGALPAQCHLLIPEYVEQDKDRFESALQQAWDWLPAAETVKKCKHEIMVTDPMSVGMAPMKRVKLFHQFVAVAVKLLGPKALYFMQSDKLVDPTHFLKVMEDEEPDWLRGLLNIRQFRLSGEEEGTILMDTLGLNVLGLPDFQVRFKRQPANMVAGLLMDYGYYIWEYGPIIHDGEEIVGIGENDRLKCSSVKSEVGPERTVIELQGID